MPDQAGVVDFQIYEERVNCQDQDSRPPTGGGGRYKGVVDVDVLRPGKTLQHFSTTKHCSGRELRQYKPSWHLYIRTAKQSIRKVDGLVEILGFLSPFFTYSGCINLGRYQRQHINTYAVGPE